MIEFDNRTGIDIDISTIEKIADTLTEKDIELILTDNTEIKEINAKFRGLDKPTDVLSFPYESMPMSPLGSIVISADYLYSGSEFYGHKPEEEMALLFIHGLLHLLDFDHETDNGEMRQKEREIIKKFLLPSSLIVRTQKETG